MADATPPAPGHRTPPLPAAGDRRPLAVAAAFCAAMLVVAVAAWQVGAPPRAADDGLPTSPPPLALPTDTPATSPLARAAVQLSTGQLEQARAGFVDVVAEDPDDVAGQVGLVLSRWRSTGPTSVERDLLQLTREYPEDALAALHLGLVQLLVEDHRAARATLRTAREVGLDEGDPTSLRMAALADDLLHPRALRGTMPVLVQPGDVPSADRPRIAALQRAVVAGDRRRAARLAAQLERSGGAMARVAAASATFEKGDPEQAVDRLQAVAHAARRDRAARDRAEFMATLARLWGGGSRDQACTRLAAHAAAPTDPRTRRLAAPIHAELCDSPASAGPGPGTRD